MARLSEHMPSRRSTGTTGRISSYINELRLAPVKPHKRMQTTYAKAIAPHVHQAVQGFVRETANQCGADIFAFKLLRQSYALWARECGLPELSDKVLGLALQATGCERRKVDPRRSGRNCYVAYKLPEAA